MKNNELKGKSIEESVKGISRKKADIFRDSLKVKDKDFVNDKIKSVRKKEEKER